MLSLGLGAAAAFGGAGADKIALYIGKPAQNRQHQPIFCESRQIGVTYSIVRKLGIAR
jgi:hypothetical protein